MKNIYTKGVLFGLAFAAIMIALIWPCDHSPKVVVNMPKDAVALQTLPPDTKILANDKAIVWWTVFKYSVDAGYGIQRSSYVADIAVDKVFNK